MRPMEMYVKVHQSGPLLSFLGLKRSWRDFCLCRSRTGQGTQ